MQTKQFMVSAEIRFTIEATSEQDAKVKSAAALAIASVEMESRRRSGIDVKGADLICVTEE